MRIAVFSDIHGNITALEAVLRNIEAQKADTLICLGDIAYKGPAPAACIQTIRELAIPCIYGNTDEYLLAAAGYGTHPNTPELPYLQWHTSRMDRADIEYLRALPFEYRLEADGQTFLFVHGTPQHCNAAIRPNDSAAMIEKQIADARADWIIMGHIHTPFLFRFENKVLANAGAVGFSLDNDWRASYLILDTADRSVSFHRVEYDMERIVSIAKDNRFCFSPEWYRDALAKGWWEPVPYGQRKAIDQFP
ncbi:MAG: hypothetical protein K0R28_4538 [Paenibacillus sp.]|nr:hypothetical protein [Paenibacillus sp.]